MRVYLEVARANDRCSVFSLANLLFVGCRTLRCGVARVVDACRSERALLNGDFNGSPTPVFAKGSGSSAVINGGPRIAFS